MPTHPNILQVLPAIESGGVERGTIEIARAIADHNWGSYVASSGGSLESTLAYAGGQHLDLPMHEKRPWEVWRNISRLQRVMHEYNIQLIHARSRAPAWAAYYAAKRAGIPFITTFHGFYGMEGLFKRRYNSIMARGQKVIAISHFIRDYILRHYPECSENDIEVIHRGADLNVFSPHAVTGGIMAELTRSWHIDASPAPIILMPGRLTRIKGHSLLIKALSRIRDRNFVALFVGSDTGREHHRLRIEEKIRKAGLEGKVRFVGKTRHMTEAYALSNIVVVPTTVPEAFGRVPVEAQAMGKIVVAAGHGGMRETIIHNQTGFLVEPNDSEALAKQLLIALSLSEERRALMGAEAIRHVHQYFSIQQMQDKTMALYESVLSSS